MNKQTARRMGEEAGINWLTVKANDEQLTAFATAVEKAQRREIERILRGMLAPFSSNGGMTISASNRNAVILEAIAAILGMGEQE